jgi:hypothetical protein
MQAVLIVSFFSGDLQDKEAAGTAVFLTGLTIRGTGLSLCSHIRLEVVDERQSLSVILNGGCPFGVAQGRLSEGSPRSD